MIYRCPLPTDEALLKEYISEHISHQECDLTATNGLERLDFHEWLAMIRKNETKGNELGRNFIYLCLEDDSLIGLLAFRPELTPTQANIYGHIGYGVRPKKRGQGYATKMLAHGLTLCKEAGLSSVIVGCYKANLPSARTIQKNGGVLIAENDNYEKGVMSQYYSISL